MESHIGGDLLDIFIADCYGKTLEPSGCRGTDLSAGRRTRLAIDFSLGWACVSHASDVLGVCIMITSALLRTETERWREKLTSLVQRDLIDGFLGRLGMTRLGSDSNLPFPPETVSSKSLPKYPPARGRLIDSAAHKVMVSSALPQLLPQPSCVEMLKKSMLEPLELEKVALTKSWPDRGIQVNAPRTAGT